MGRLIDILERAGAQVCALAGCQVKAGTAVGLLSQWHCDWVVARSFIEDDLIDPQPLAALQCPV